MAEYFDTREDAEQFVQEWYAKDGKPPVFFGKILNHGVVKWLVNYDPNQQPSDSRYIKVQENHSSEILQIVSASSGQVGTGRASATDKSDQVLLTEVTKTAEAAEELAVAREQLLSKHADLLRNYASTIQLRIEHGRREDERYRRACVTLLTKARDVESAITTLRRLENKYRKSVSNPAIDKAITSIKQCRKEVGIRIRCTLWLQRSTS